MDISLLYCSFNLSISPKFNHINFGWGLRSWRFCKVRSINPKTEKSQKSKLLETALLDSSAKYIWIIWSWGLILMGLTWAFRKSHCGHESIHNWQHKLLVAWCVGIVLSIIASKNHALQSNSAEFTTCGSLYKAKCQHGISSSHSAWMAVRISSVASSMAAAKSLSCVSSFLKSIHVCDALPWPVARISIQNFWKPEVCGQIRHLRVKCHHRCKCKV